ncbi:uncharacterized protein LOC123406190 isoform X3 [Hordeum vulgare subsp. vulgare]|uniref:Uncharacterized protein n=1 Tax=Hordeum vulgare subsp. vulgare TaxID=112509 RepID=A0A8I7BH56_HORVV|nr:uncharacterized protein LOC123406190 isoform X3 [Hordeum vulgare subsp. vulgare]
MAAVRCAARRLGGALLQRAQAEEGRLLAPSRLMRSRHLSTKVSGEQACNIQKEEEDIWAGFKETLKKLDQLPKKEKPSVFQQRMKSIDRAVKAVVYGSFKLTIVVMAAATAFSGNGVKA